MRLRSPNFKPLPLDMVGSTVFGRYPKISSEATYNMIISDGWLVPYAGYRKVATILEGGRGRGIFRSSPLGAIISVVENNVYFIDTNLTVDFVSSISTYLGEVFIDEDTTGHIAICDKKDIWIYNPSANFTSTFYKATTDGTTPLDFVPGYVSFQNGRFISVDLQTSQWALSKLITEGDAPNPDTVVTFPNDAQHRGQFQTKADRPVAAIRFPGKGNLLLILGSISGEFWQDVGAALFPYQRSSAVNLDYGCVNAATIGASENMVCWLAQNERTGPFIVFSTGGPAQKISTDGIDFKLSQLTAPEDCVGFMFKQDGHLFYQINFTTDNESYVYDFNTQRFFTITDHEMNYHPARHIAFLDNQYFFVSGKDGNLYELGSEFTTYDGNEIPRIRISKTIRLPDTSPFITNNITFPIEQGEESSITPRVDLSVSLNGGASFGTWVGMEFNSVGHRRNKFQFNNLGQANEMTFQFRFWGDCRFVVGDGVTSIYQ